MKILYLILSHTPLAMSLLMAFAGGWAIQRGNVEDYAIAALLLLGSGLWCSIYRCKIFDKDSLSPLGHE